MEASRVPPGNQPPRLPEAEDRGARGPRRLWEGWLAVSARFGFAQTLVILAFFYALLIGPVALVAGLARRDLLDKRGLRRRASAWRPADSAAPDLERAKLST